MGSIPFDPPKYMASGFSCPNCGAHSHQKWSEVRRDTSGVLVDDLRAATCARCQEYSLWVKAKMIFPGYGTAPLPNPDLPAEAAADYTEAREIIQRSPRAAAALLRLAIQRLTHSVLEGDATGHLNTDIGKLVKRGLAETVQEALDAVRVIGNNAVHPGQIDLRDDVDTAAALFALVNLVCEKMISDPKKVRAIYDKLPEGARKQIKKRDGIGAPEVEPEDQS